MNRLSAYVLIVLTKVSFPGLVLLPSRASLSHLIWVNMLADPDPMVAIAPWAGLSRRLVILAAATVQLWDDQCRPASVVPCHQGWVALCPPAVVRT